MVRDGASDDGTRSRQVVLPARFDHGQTRKLVDGNLAIWRTVSSILVDLSLRALESAPSTRWISPASGNEWSTFEPSVGPGGGWPQLELNADA
ncbi:hypothetical protein MRB53_038688 [Persea americana]|nr:hypothetical protein MRB53_038688 [Persea americana]